MKSGKKNKIYTIGIMSFFITLAVFSSSPIVASNIDVQITTLEVYEFPPNFYDINVIVHNYEDYDIVVQEIEHTYIYPNGTNHTVTMGPWSVEANSDYGVAILCMYPPRIKGTYTWIVTLRDASGTILDEQSISWERSSIWGMTAIRI